MTIIRQIPDTDPIVNGDPIVIVPNTERIVPLQSAISLGTGFESWDHLEQELEHAIQYGEPTQNITPHNAKDWNSSEKRQKYLTSAI